MPQQELHSSARYCLHYSGNTRTVIYTVHGLLIFIKKIIINVLKLYSTKPTSGSVSLTNQSEHANAIRISVYYTPFLNTVKTKLAENILPSMRQFYFTTNEEEQQRNMF